MTPTTRVLALLAGADAETGSPPTSAPRTRLLALTAVSAGVAAMLAGVGLMAAAGYLLSRAADRPPILDLALVFVAVRFFGLARPALRYAERLVSHDVTLRLLRRVRRWFCEALVPLAPAGLTSWRSGDLLARLASDVDTLQDAFLRLAAPVVVAVAVGLVAAGALALVDPRLSAVFLLVLLANGVLWPWFGARAARGVGRARNETHAALTSDLVTLFQGLDDAVSCGREGAERARLRAHQQTLDDLDRRAGVVSALQAAAGVAFSGLGVGAVLFVLALRVEAGDLPGVWVAALTLAVLAAFEAVDALPQAWLAREPIDDSARRVFAIVDATPAVVERAGPHWAGLGSGDAGQPVATAAPAVALEHVTFSYADYPTSVGAVTLDDVSCAVAPGEHVAIVGPSGSGKSTLLALVCRFHDPGRGRIALDGRDLTGLRLADLRRSLAFVPQQVHVFDASLRDNVRIARPEASDAEVRRVLRLARLDGMADARAGGLDARLGEAGVRLSAGERQRLGLARLFLADPPLVLVDEPTAHLDAETERDVLATLRAWARNRTLLLVSHRLSCVCDFDRLLVVAAGRIVAAGPHASLVRTSDVYRSQWTAERQLL